MRKGLIVANCTAYVMLIVIANVLTSHYGLVSVGFGLSATAGVFAAGATLTLRDWLQEIAGRSLILALIATGAVLSAMYGSGRVALASGVAFLLSELLDLAVFSALRERGWTVAVWVSAATAAPLDTLLFLSIAGFPITAAGVAGQLVGKGWATLAMWACTVPVFAYIRWTRGAVPDHGN